MSSYYNGSQEREWPGSEDDPQWCYVCDRPKNDCACHLDPNGPICEKAGCTKDATVIMANGTDPARSTTSILKGKDKTK